MRVAKNAAEAKESTLASAMKSSPGEREKVKVTNARPGQNPGWQEQAFVPARRRVD
jgi:hypothetical protein